MAKLLVGDAVFRCDLLLVGDAEYTAGVVVGHRPHSFRNERIRTCIIAGGVGEEALELSRDSNMVSK